MDEREAHKWIYYLYSIGLIDVERLYQIIYHLRSDPKLPSYWASKDKAEALKEKYPEEYLIWRTKRRLLGEK